jgi:pimeloyl-ACP methyl ester carboxylesterase
VDRLHQRLRQRGQSLGRGGKRKSEGEHGMKIIGVAGTWDDQPAWIEDPAGPFQVMLAGEGFEIARSTKTGLPFRWSTKLSGLPFVNRGEWQRAGDELFAFLHEFPYEDRNIIAHSHGGQVALFAAASDPAMQIRTLTTVGTPVRKDVPALDARKHIDYWQHISDLERDWTATMRRTIARSMGQVGDGDLSFERRFLIPGVINIQLADISHSKVLRDPAYIPYWLRGLWLEAIRTRGGLDPI